MESVKVGVVLAGHPACRTLSLFQPWLYYQKSIGRVMFGQIIKKGILGGRVIS